MSNTSSFWFQGEEAPTPDGPVIGHSLRFKGTQNTFKLYRDNITSGARSWTWSGWVKISRWGDSMTLFTPTFEVSDVSGSYSCGLSLSEQFQFQTSSVANNGGSYSQARTRDPAAWYHLVYNVDFDNDTSDGYINGERVMGTISSEYSLVENFQAFGSSMGFGFGGTSYNKYLRGEGYVADVYLIDGQALGPEAFGELNEDGVWVPREVSFAYGQNSYSSELYASTTNSPPDFDSTTSYPIANGSKGFDGNITTYNHGGAGVPNNGALVWRLGTPVENVTGINFYGSTFVPTWYINRVEQPASSYGLDGLSNKAQVYSGDPITVSELAIKCGNNNNSPGWSAIEFQIDGGDYNILIDPNVWSADLYTYQGSQDVIDSGPSAANLASTEKDMLAGAAAEYGFDGSGDNYTYSNLGQAWVWRPSTPIQGVTKIELKNATGENVWINDIKSGNVGGDDRRTYYDGSAITLETLSGLVAPYSASSGSGFGQLWINGQLYIDGQNPNYGVNGFHLDFADPNDIGKDVSGNGNDLTAEGFDTNYTPPPEKPYKNFGDSTVYQVPSGGEIPNPDGSGVYWTATPDGANINYNDSNGVNSGLGYGVTGAHVYSSDYYIYGTGTTANNPTWGNWETLTFSFKDYPTVTSVRIFGRGGDDFSGSDDGRPAYDVDLLDASGSVLSTFVGTNSGPGEFNKPMAWWDLEVPEGSNPRSVRFSRAGTGAYRIGIGRIEINGEVQLQGAIANPKLDVMQDSPTQNFATFNPIVPQYNIISEAALTTQGQSALDQYFTTVTQRMDVATYGEFVAEGSATTYPAWGICNAFKSTNVRQGYDVGGQGVNTDPNSVSITGTGWRYIRGIASQPAGQPTWGTGDTIRWKFDPDSGVCSVAVNTGDWFDWYTLSQEEIEDEDFRYFCSVNGNVTGTAQGKYNFGQQTFAYEVPDGYYALQTQNHPKPPIRNGRDYFRAIAGSGGGNFYAGQLFVDDRNVDDPNYYATSQGFSEPAVQGFDEDLSTFCQASAGNAGNWLIFRPTPSITVNSSLRIYTDGMSAVRVNEVDTGVNESNGIYNYKWFDIPVTTPLTLTNLAIRGYVDTGSLARFNAIEVDGVILGGDILSVANTIFPHGLYWIKSRENDSSENYHQFVDTNRGIDRVLWCPNQANEGGYSSPTGNSVAWCWAVDGLPQDNNDGDLTAAVATSARGGFSIINYTGTGVDNTKIGHGLGAKPDFILLRNRTNGSPYWSVFNSGTYSGASAPQVQYLDQNHSATNDINVFGSAAEQTDTYFTVGTYEGTNESASSIQAYAWRAIPGYSAFGKYDTNGDADGPMVNLGFRPAFLMLKNIGVGGSGYSWFIYDTTRNPHNPVGYTLSSDTFGPEATNINLDIVSNGFKIKDTAGAINSNHVQYAAFAENPFSISNAR